jgi:putative ABC transport system permease protein
VIAVYLSAIVVGVTMGATIARQARDIALVRAIGAAPRQVRSAIAGQAVLVAVPATLVGVPLGVLGGRAWIHGLVAHGVIPAEVGFHADPAALPIALAVSVGTSLLGALVAAIRPARVRPAVALTETAAPELGVGLVRTVAGLLLVAAGGVLSTVLTGDGRLFVMLAMCLGTGFLGPALLRATALLARPVGRLAADNLAVHARSYSGALVPLTLAIAFATVKVAAHAGVTEPAADRWTDYSGTAVYTAFAAVAALNALITVMVSRGRDLAVTRLAGGTRGRVLGVVICEALVVTVVSLLAAAVVATTTLGSFRLPPIYLSIAVVVLVLGGTALPAAVGMRRPPVEVAG